MQLIEYVHREGGSKWKVIGWLQINESGNVAPAPSPAAPPTSGVLPTPAESPASE